jgi:hypothetical protein
MDEVRTLNLILAKGSHISRQNQASWRGQGEAELLVERFKPVFHASSCALDRLADPSYHPPSFAQSGEKRDKGGVDEDLRN